MRPTEWAQCTIRIPDGKRSIQANVDSISALRGVLKVEVDHLNGIIIVDYNPSLVSVKDIRAKAQSKRD